MEISPSCHILGFSHICTFWPPGSDFQFFFEEWSFLKWGKEVEHKNWLLLSFGLVSVWGLEKGRKEIACIYGLLCWWGKQNKQEWKASLLKMEYHSIINSISPVYRVIYKGYAKSLGVCPTWISWVSSKVIKKINTLTVTLTIELTTHLSTWIS